MLSGTSQPRAVTVMRTDVYARLRMIHVFQWTPNGRPMDASMDAGNYRRFRAGACLREFYLMYVFLGFTTITRLIRFAPASIGVSIEVSIGRPLDVHWKPIVPWKDAESMPHRGYSYRLGHNW